MLWTRARAGTPAALHSALKRREKASGCTGSLGAVQPVGWFCAVSRRPFTSGPRTPAEPYGARLALVLPGAADNLLVPTALPLKAPALISPGALLGIECVSTLLQAAVLAHHTGRPVSRSTANRAARAYRQRVVNG